MTDTIPLDDLSAIALHSTPVDIDWREAKGEDMDGWRFWEAFEAEVTLDDATSVTLWLISVDGSEADVAFTEDGSRIDLNDPDDSKVECTACAGTGETERNVTEDGMQEPEECPRCSGTGEMLPDGLTDGDLDDLSREPHGYAEGPMMNYWYPLDENDENSIGAYGHTFDAAEAAFRLRHHSLCLVDVDGNLGLALTGGGMDFTWDIAEAFIDLGYLPPLHFCDLPGMAGHGPSKRNADGWTVGQRDDDTAPHGYKVTVTAPDGTVTEFDDYYAADRTIPKVDVPASEDHQRIIDAVTKSLTTAQERIGYQLQRHQERYSPPTPAEQP